MTAFYFWIETFEGVLCNYEYHKGTQEYQEEKNFLEPLQQNTHITQESC